MESGSRDVLSNTVDGVKGKSTDATPSSPPQPAPAERRPLQLSDLTPEQQAEYHRRMAVIQAEEDAEELKYGTEAVVKLIIPVTICMALVILIIRTITYFGKDQGTYLAYIVYDESSGSNASLFGQALINALIIIAVVVVMTFFLVFLYKMRCYKLIGGWLMFTSVILLFMFSFTFWNEVLLKYNVAMDYITTALVIWNFGIVGLLSIHWKGPLLLQQTYLICVSALMALTLIKYLPTWTTWVLLALIAVYDIIAVLCPGGPLRMLVETAQERNETLMPALIYSSTMMWIGMADVDRTTSSGGKALMENFDESEDVLTVDESEESSDGTPSLALLRENRPSSASQQSTIDEAEAGATADAPVTTNSGEDDDDDEEEESSGVKLGLGDFIFYSLLVGTAASRPQWGTVFACYYGICAGLVLTLLLLAVFKKALPALPISVAFGILFYFVTDLVVIPLTDRSALNQVFF